MPEPIIDPVTGKPAEPPAGDPPPTDPPPAPTQADFDALKARLDAFDRPAPIVAQAPPAAPAAPPGPTLADQVSEIDTEIVTLDASIKEAEAAEKPFATLQNRRMDLTNKRQSLTSQAEISELRTIGISQMDALSTAVIEDGGRMPLLKHDFVKKAYDAAIAQLPAEHRMNIEVKKFAYERAVGANVEKLNTFATEEAIRKHQEDHPATPPGGDPGTRFVDAKGDAIPTPEEVFGKEGMAALRHVAGGDVDRFCQMKGYNNYAEWWEKVGKEYTTAGGAE